MNCKGAKLSMKFLVLVLLAIFTFESCDLRCPWETDTTHGCPGSPEYEKKKRSCERINLVAAMSFGRCTDLSLTDCKDPTYAFMRLACAAGCPGTDSCF